MPRATDAAMVTMLALAMGCGDNLEPPPGRPDPGQRIYGVTVANPWDQLPDIVDSLASLSMRPTTRIVFDELEPAARYVPVATQIHAVSATMGEVLDSAYVAHYTVPQYEAWTREYLDTLGDHIDIWEVGNEINGEWLGDTPSVVAKMTVAFDLVRAAGKPTALTLFDNVGCVADPGHELFAWLPNIPERMRLGLDYVLVSTYDEDCRGYALDWDVTFARLGEVFPNAKLGFGETGTLFADRKPGQIDRFYRMQVAHDRFVAGNFWWFFDSNDGDGEYLPGDMVPKTRPLWRVLDDAMVAGGAARP